MYSLIAASAFFLLIHFGVSGTRLRDVLVARIVVIAIAAYVMVLILHGRLFGAPLV